MCVGQSLLLFRRVSFLLSPGGWEGGRGKALLFVVHAFRNSA